MKNISVSVNGEEVTKGKKKEYEPWEIKNALGTLIEAAEIMENKDLYKKVQAMMEKTAKKITSIQDIRDAANNYKEEEKAEGETLDKKMTPDDHAEEESKEKRVKSSSNPTMVGRQYK